MLSNNGNSSSARETSRKRRRGRRDRACDICRQKKVKCKFPPKNALGKCLNCIAFAEACTFDQPPPEKHVSPYPKGYVDELQARISQVEELLHRIKPDCHISDDADDASSEEAWLSDDSTSEATQPEFSYLVPPSIATPSDTPDGIAVNDPLFTPEVAEALSHLSTEFERPTSQSFGDSSPYQILEIALDMRSFSGLPPLKLDRLDDRQPSCLCPLLCHVHPWSLFVNDVLSVTTLEFPPPDLTISLVDLYFTFYNSYLPILHRQTFAAAVLADLHIYDPNFGNVVLLVCALGSKVSDDRRVLLEENTPDTWHSAGWKWFRQVHVSEKALFSRTTLYDVQVACLSAIFLKNTSMPDSSHISTGLGLRLAQNLGAHRRKTYSGMQQPDKELLKRVFWVLVFLDWSYSSAVGRPSGIHHEDIDADQPSEVDDEYWIHPDPNIAFRQPPGVPSQVMFFNCLLRLTQIQAFTYRTLYSSPKARVSMKAKDATWEQRVVIELEAALSSWFRCIPVHLQWDPRNPSVLFLSQSATLYAAYYGLQIAIHRPFIPHPLNSEEPSALSSLASCTTAAKSCVCVLGTLSRRTSPLLATGICDNLICLFVCGIALLIDIWREKELRGLAAHNHAEATYISQTKDILKQTESRWHSSGRIWDMLNAVAVAGDISTSPRIASEEVLSSDERVAEELWLQRYLRRAGKHTGDRSFIYHHPLVTGKRDF